jgi:hypothetical protein
MPTSDGGENALGAAQTKVGEAPREAEHLPINGKERMRVGPDIGEPLGRDGFRVGRDRFRLGGAGFGIDGAGFGVHQGGDGIGICQNRDGIGGSEGGDGIRVCHGMDEIGGSEGRDGIGGNEGGWGSDDDQVNVQGMQDN